MTAEDLLQCAYGTTARAERFYKDQMLDHLNPAMIEFVKRMEMAFIATADARGNTDCSFRAGPAGFIRVLDHQRVAYPEYRGNGVLASLGNITENPHLSLLLIDFSTARIGLHLNGAGYVVTDEEIRTACPWIPVEQERGRRAERWVVLWVHEAYVHCRKHIPRLVKAPADRAWGTDDVRSKGGDYFGVRSDKCSEKKASTLLQASSADGS
ncbi:pyridoxamine 5'-phosphate oxidase family protein [Amycolatopsis sp. cg5]|uniref:pyridoxamine 5'-phosphate oxidase family protein n=1 Tax=Amycolatopsis sp. cg5 TaxID=3238802 RepID=UPI0035259994